jgi:hypothetical protein
MRSRTVAFAAVLAFLFAACGGRNSSPPISASNLVDASSRTIGVQEVANMTAGAKRPARVPEGYLVTPFGYFHPSCVWRLAQGDSPMTDTRVCHYPHYSHDGTLIPLQQASAAEGRAPQIDGWLIDSANTPSSTTFGMLVSTWTVPALPASNDGQTLFFFPGLEDYPNVRSILQPVLQDYVPTGWQVASWNCCLHNGTWESTPIAVHPGDTILGTIAPTCNELGAGGHCPGWNVTSADQTTGQSTTLSDAATLGQTWNWAFSAVTENYGVVQCSDFGGTGVTFNTTLYNDKMQTVTNPGFWGTPPSYIATSPWCDYSDAVSNNSNTSTLSYTDSDAAQPLSGVYAVKNKAGGLNLSVSGSSVANDAPIDGQTGVGPYSEWIFTPTANGYYQIVNLNSMLDVAVSDASTSAGAALVQYAYGTTGEDQWKPIENKDGTYKFRNLLSGMFLTDPGGSATQGTPLTQSPAGGDTSQSWSLFNL